MELFEKKAKFADLIDAYVNDASKEKELLDYVLFLKNDGDFDNYSLFTNTFEEFLKFLNTLPKKYLKQRAMMIRDFNDFD